MSRTDLLDRLQVVVSNINEALGILAELEEGQLLHHNIGNLQQAGGQAQQSELEWAPLPLPSLTHFYTLKASVLYYQG